MFNQLKHIRARREDLRREIDVVANFEEWEESCIPSYCHPNWLAAYVSWLRLFEVAKLASRHAPYAAKMLDFGASTGELGHLVSQRGTGYDFIEIDEKPVEYLLSRLPNAQRKTLEGAPNGQYDVVFAIDSLEHNTAYSELLEILIGKLKPSGVLILSGPTESGFYRLGRRIAGFDGHYHETTILEIEAAAGCYLGCREVRLVMPVATLFRISAWAKRSTA